MEKRAQLLPPVEEPIQRGRLPATDNAEVVLPTHEEDLRMHNDVGDSTMRGGVTPLRAGDPDAPEVATPRGADQGAGGTTPRPGSTFVVAFPDLTPEEPEIVETPLMVKTANRTMAVHPGGAMVVWTGPSRNGKTEAAKWLAAKINAAAQQDMRGFRAALFEYGGSGSTWAGNEMKRALRSVYHATVAKLDEGLFRQLPAEDLAKHVVEGLRAKNIQMVFVDEAGLLELDGIRGLVLLRDVAQLHGWRLTIVLIGMDSLPVEVKKLPQVERRIHEWCYFQPYGVAETLALLVGLDPQFAALDIADAGDRAMVEFIHRVSGGLPGLVAPFLLRLRYQQRLLDGEPLSLELLHATHLMTTNDQERAVTDAMAHQPGQRGRKRRQG